MPRKNSQNNIETSGDRHTRGQNMAQDKYIRDYILQLEEVRRSRYIRVTSSEAPGKRKSAPNTNGGGSESRQTEAPRRPVKKV